MIDLATILLSALINFLYIFLKAIQQLNVVHGRYALVYPVSILMGICEACILLYIVKTGSIWIGVSNGAGAGFGAILAMWLHKKTLRK